MRQLKWVCGILIALGILGKFYRIDDPWKRADHYNYGGALTTEYAECLKRTPLAESKGIPHERCGMKEPVRYYPNHPPTILFALWAWTSVFGNAEWAYRLFILLFSTINIGLVGLIARRARPESELFPWLAATMQAIFLGGLYFGTHPDFIGEFTVTFTLLSAYLALGNRTLSACALALVAGITAWPGYLMFGVLWLRAAFLRRDRVLIFVCGAVAFNVALATMMWLHQTFDVVAFLKMKLLAPGYVKPDNGGWLEPVHFVRNFFTTQSRLLGPLLSAVAFFELIRGKGRSQAVWLAGGTGFLYALIGHEYVMVHGFLYLLFTPALALLAARFFERWATNEITFSRIDFRWLAGLIVLQAALYPYGIYKTNTIHDALTSVALILTALGLLWVVKRNPQSVSMNVIAIFLVLAFAANLSQMMNYRNEPDTERSFCEQAKAEYERTGQPVHTKFSRTKFYLYCRDLPVIYE
ncbi:MAG TPA: hypothetical protein VM432_02530 [Bdellovibrionales bacterium]|jgi:hypothetical protein|nr:hypothetical protein [Bdellovibrionales bacterium]